MVRYLNTDLILRARFNLAPFAEALESAGLMMIGDMRIEKRIYEATFETPASGSSDRPEKDIRGLLKVIEYLSDDERDMWNRCLERRFDMGFDSSREEYESSFQVGNDLIRRIGAVGGNLVVTIYRPPE